MTTHTHIAPLDSPATASAISLEQARFIALVTFRRNGTPVSTPVLFVPDGGRLLVRTAHGTGKLKRIAHTPEVLVVPCDSRGRGLGVPVHGRARILGEEAVPETLSRLHDRHPVAGRLFSIIRRVRGQRNVVIEVTLGEALSETGA